MDRKTGPLMLRELTGFLLLLILLLAGFFSACHLYRQTAPVAAVLEDSAWLALSGQWENARHQAEDARKQWDAARTACAIFGDHRPMEEVDALFRELNIHAAAGNRSEFARICSALSGRLETMARNHRLCWQNIL